VDVLSPHQRADTHASVLAYLTSPRCSLFAESPEPIRIRASSAAALVDAAPSPLHALDTLRALDAAGHRFDSFSALVDAVATLSLASGAGGVGPDASLYAHPHALPGSHAASCLSLSPRSVPGAPYGSGYGGNVSALSLTSPASPSASASASALESPASTRTLRLPSLYGQGYGGSAASLTSPASASHASAAAAASYAAHTSSLVSARLSALLAVGPSSAALAAADPAARRAKRSLLAGPARASVDGPTPRGSVAPAHTLAPVPSTRAGLALGPSRSTRSLAGAGAVGAADYGAYGGPGRAQPPTVTSGAGIGGLHLPLPPPPPALTGRSLPLPDALRAPSAVETARLAVLQHLSSSRALQQLLFAVTPAGIAASPQALDRLVLAAGGTAADTVALLGVLARAAPRLSAFGQLIPAVAALRTKELSRRRAKLLAYLRSPRCTLFSGPPSSSFLSSASASASSLASASASRREIKATLYELDNVIALCAGGVLRGPGGAAFLPHEITAQDARELSLSGAPPGGFTALAPGLTHAPAHGDGHGHEHGDGCDHYGHHHARSSSGGAAAAAAAAAGISVQAPLHPVDWLLPGMPGTAGASPPAAPGSAAAGTAAARRGRTPATTDAGVALEGSIPLATTPIDSAAGDTAPSSAAAGASPAGGAPGSLRQGPTLTLGAASPLAASLASPSASTTATTAAAVAAAGAAPSPVAAGAGVAAGSEPEIDPVDSAIFCLGRLDAAGERFAAFADVIPALHEMAYAMRAEAATARSAYLEQQVRLQRAQIAGQRRAKAEAAAAGDGAASNPLLMGGGGVGSGLYAAARGTAGAAGSAASRRRASAAAMAVNSTILDEQQLMSFLASPNCYLFLDAPETISIHKRGFDELVSAGEGNAACTLYMLQVLNSQNYRFVAFTDLLSAVRICLRYPHPHPHPRVHPPTLEQARLKGVQVFDVRDLQTTFGNGIADDGAVKIRSQAEVIAAERVRVEAERRESERHRSAVEAMLRREAEEALGRQQAELALAAEADSRARAAAAAGELQSARDALAVSANSGAAREALLGEAAAAADLERRAANLLRDRVGHLEAELARANAETEAARRAAAAALAEARAATSAATAAEAARAQAAAEARAAADKSAVSASEAAAAAASAAVAAADAARERARAVEAEAVRDAAAAAEATTRAEEQRLADAAQARARADTQATAAAEAANAAAAAAAAKAPAQAEAEAEATAIAAAPAVAAALPETGAGSRPLSPLEEEREGDVAAEEAASPALPAGGVILPVGRGVASSPRAHGGRLQRQRLVTRGGTEITFEFAPVPDAAEVYQFLNSPDCAVLFAPSAVAAAAEAGAADGPVSERHVTALVDECRSPEERRALRVAALRRLITDPAAADAAAAEADAADAAATAVGEPPASADTTLPRALTLSAAAQSQAPASNDTLERVKAYLLDAIDSNLMFSSGAELVRYVAQTHARREVAAALAELDAATGTRAARPDTAATAGPVAAAAGPAAAVDHDEEAAWTRAVDDLLGLGGSLDFTLFLLKDLAATAATAADVAATAATDGTAGAAAVSAVAALAAARQDALRGDAVALLEEVAIFADATASDATEQDDLHVEGDALDALVLSAGGVPPLEALMRKLSDRGERFKGFRALALAVRGEAIAHETAHEAAQDSAPAAQPAIVQT
jgi:hypothetical protein